MVYSTGHDLHYTTLYHDLPWIIISLLVMAHIFIFINIVMIMLSMDCILMTLAYNIILIVVRCDAAC